MAKMEENGNFNESVWYSVSVFQNDKKNVLESYEEKTCVLKDKQANIEVQVSLQNNPNMLFVRNVVLIGIAHFIKYQKVV